MPAATAVPADPTTTPPAPDPTADLDRQLQVLVSAGYPALAGLDDDTFRSLAEPLRPRLPDTGFVLATAPGLVPAERLIERTSLTSASGRSSKTGFTSMPDEDVRRFVPTDDVQLPDAALYLLCDVDTGAATLGVRPDDALPDILASGRSPLTLEEGLAVVTQHPTWLREHNCFELLGSRCGDKRVTGLWISKGAPRLGWCWGGNPHTWLGMATVAVRVG